MNAIIKLIENDQLHEAIEELSKKCDNLEDILQRLILQKSRLIRIDKDFRKGVINYQQKTNQKNQISDAVINITFELKKHLDDKEESSTKQISEIPYGSFNQSFREVVTHQISSSKSYLHIVFGDISDVENINIVVGCSQDFDLYQSDHRSALGSLWKIEMNNNLMLDEINKTWKNRPITSGIGTSKFVSLTENSNNLNGIIFTVTTRNLSNDNIDKGLYTSTPVEGIPIIIDKVFKEVGENNLSSVAIPLLGAGFANIAVTYNNIELRHRIEETILCITIDECLDQLIGENQHLERIIIVIYSKEPQSEREHKLFKLSLKMLTPNKEKRIRMIDDLIARIE